MGSDIRLAVLWDWRPGPGARSIRRFTPLWQTDNDPAALTVLAHHWPGVRRYADVKEIDASTARVTVVCGGFPCQPHSVAGKRRGISDERWLWPEFARVIEAITPTAVFIENVPGLRTSGLRRVLQDLADLGFDAEWDYFFAAEAGAPHRRQRLFILAYADGFLGRVQPGRPGRQDGSDPIEPRWDGPPWIVADANRERRLEPEGPLERKWRWTRDGDRWAFESPVPGVAHGIPGRMDRHRLTGNAVVWQQAAIALETLAARATIARA